MAEITDTALQGTSKSPNTITLQEFNNRIKRLLADPSVMNCWVVAETTDVRINQHCYLQLLEKNPKTGATVAKIKAIIWGSQFRFLNARFKQVTGRDIGNDMKIMVCLSVNYSPQYGLTVVINDINPEFTLGDMERQRQEILNRLTQEGIIGQNKTVPVPPVLQRIATVPTVLAALDKVEQNQHLFDCVVIIRGGGGTEELNSFDNYDLARRVATFPLPVIVGIGHERDITVLDYVAGIRVKTPTAAAEHIILQAANALAHIGDLSNQVVSIARDYIARAKEQLSYYAGNLPIMAQNIPLHVQRRIEGENAQLARQKDAIKNAVAQVKMKETMRLEALGDKIELLSPRKVMARGYTLTTCEGKIMTDAAQLEAGKLVTIHFRDGKVVAGTQSVIKDK